MFFFILSGIPTGLLSCGSDRSDSRDPSGDDANRSDEHADKPTLDPTGAVEPTATEAKSLCEGREPTHCHELGRAYHKGDGVPEDLTRAAQLYRESCDGGYTLGCYDLGKLYKDGKGVDRDLTRASMIFEKVCDTGEMMGCNNLGTLYRDGEGVNQDMARATQLFDQACTQDNKRGCHNMAEMWDLQSTFNERGQGPNPGLTCEYWQCACAMFTAYDRACDLGYEKSCKFVQGKIEFNLGHCFEPW